ncbi:PaaI family thioesterase [Lysobacter terrae]
MTDLKERISASFAAQGLMTTLGAELVHIAHGEVHIALLPRPELTQQHGYIHAGAITSVVDSACGYAALTVAPPGHDVLTVEFKVNFMRPAAGNRFLAVGKVIKAGKTLTVCQGEVVSDQGAKREAVAVMQATIINVADLTGRRS